ncbi:ferredoxin domain-containing protein [Natranaerofaba carboxydovora]|uniref:ferredoxin domain-containing protein n=1 Tax=Natranaerofaba carboxydovora TaxID=2742683 RepID=UPI001F140C0E|nr:DUF2148 domain-containing protein [Natranaerofaba carboxydovora]UMZ75153.1 hypothetical protein ACONDI_02765 [Natranaerofaba carboxydovora]
MIIEGKAAEKKGLKQVAELICVAARTAPKGKGVDNIVTAVISDESLEKLQKEMYRIADEEGAEFFRRDAGCLENTPYIVLIGTKIEPVGVAPCGYCGYLNCKENKKNNGICAFNTGDLGIAIGSAVSKAADFRVDNRVLFTAGKAALNLGFLGEEVKIAYGIPLTSSGKNIFFDREKK